MPTLEKESSKINNLSFQCKKLEGETHIQSKQKGVNKEQKQRN